MAAAKTKEPAKPKGKRGPKVKYDYEKAMQFFVEGMPVDEDDPDGDRDWPNLRVISERLNIPYERIREQSSKNRWADLKTGYQRQAAQDRQKKRMEKMGQQAIEFDERGLDIAKIGLQLIGVRMGEIARLVSINKSRRADVERRYAEGAAVDKTELWSMVRADEMERLAKAAQTLQEIGRKALGTDIERVQTDVTVSVEGVINVAQELERDDPDRLAAFIAAADRAGIWEQLEALEGPDDVDDDDDVVEAELVEEP